MTENNKQNKNVIYVYLLLAVVSISILYVSSKIENISTTIFDISSQFSFNLGLINSMQLEGFDSDYIEKEGKIYGALLKNNSENADMFGYYLTHKIENPKLKK